MRVSRSTEHNFEHLSIEMDCNEAAEVLENLSGMLREALRGNFNAGFYAEETFNFKTDDGYPSYLNQLHLRINAPKKGKG